MANKRVFNALRDPRQTTNEAGGTAYLRSAEEALAQLACTGTFNNTFYTKAEDQLQRVLELAERVSPLFLAKLTIYARESAWMKDMPAVLLAILSRRDAKLFEQVFPRVVSNARMLRTFMQVLLSKQTGRSESGKVVKRALRGWFETHSAEQIFKGNIGVQPSMVDIIKTVHPVPVTPNHQAVFRYILGKEGAAYSSELPTAVKQFEHFKAARLGDVSYSDSLGLPDVPFQMLTGLPLTDTDWKMVADQMSWQKLRQNLNTLQRHNVFTDNDRTYLVANKLSSQRLIEQAKAFPFQIFSAYLNIGEEIPAIIRTALEEAAEIATQNIPWFPGTVYICVDTSGSMGSSLTGDRGQGATSKMRVIDAASVIASAIARRADGAVILPFDTTVHGQIAGKYGILATAAELRQYGGGGTAISEPLHWLNRNHAHANLVLFLSDYESWFDPQDMVRSRVWKGTQANEAWNIFKHNNPQAKLVCVNLQPNETVQVPSSPDTLNIGGWNDTLFTTVNQFVQGTKESWLKEIDIVEV